MRALDDPRFGRAEPCACVLREGDDERRARLERISNLGALTRFTFDTLTGERLGDAVNVARRYAAEPEGWLVLTGPSGSGKTHLAAAIANARIAEGAPALFMVVPDLLDHLRAGYSAAEEEWTYERLFEHVRTAPLLILDDIDAASPTDWAREKLFQLVNARYNASLPTVFTCRALPGSLDERLATRLQDPLLTRALALEPAGEQRYRQVGGMTPKRLESMTFGNFRLPTGRDDESESLRAAAQVAARFADEPEGWLVLQGTNGCGKTHLACALAGRALRDGRNVFFAVVPDLLDHLRARYAPEAGAPPHDDLFDEVRNAELLVLDDLGAQATSSWALEKLYQIANYRTSTGLATIVTTDLGMDELKTAYPRIATRILDPRMGTVITILAPAYRLGEFPRAPRRRGAR